MQTPRRSPPGSFGSVQSKRGGSTEKGVEAKTAAQADGIHPASVSEPPAFPEGFSQAKAFEKSFEVPGAFPNRTPGKLLSAVLRIAAVPKVPSCGGKTAGSVFLPALPGSQDAKTLFPPPPRYTKAPCPANGIRRKTEYPLLPADCQLADTTPLIQDRKPFHLCHLQAKRPVCAKLMHRRAASCNFTG